MRSEKFSFTIVFLLGLFIGILMVRFGKSFLLENTGMLDEYTLYRMKYMTVDSRALFYYVLRARIFPFVILAVLATTYLGVFLCIGASFWYGMSGGLFLSIAVSRYGLKGISFVLVGLLPHFLFYVPVAYFLFRWCETICRGIYFQKNFQKEEKKIFAKSKYVFQLLLLFLVLFVGCILESFVAPKLLLTFLQVF